MSNSHINRRLDGFAFQVLLERIALAHEQRAQDILTGKIDPFLQSDVVLSKIERKIVSPFLRPNVELSEVDRNIAKRRMYVELRNYASKVRGDIAITESGLLAGGLSPHVGSNTGNSQRFVYDADGKEEIPTKPVRTEGQPDLKPDPHWVNPTYEQSGAVRDYYLNTHEWKSIDNKGMDMHSVDDYADNYDNAFWDEKEMVYGAGDGTTFRKGGFNEITVSGHEMTHGVTAHRSGLVYRDWPGIINEHLSDVGGINVKHLKEKLGPDKEENWLLGANIFAPGVNGRAIRHMLNPGTAFDDWRLGGKDPQPASYKDYQQTDSDNGGVHLYSGIPNKAYAVFAQEVGLPVYEFVAHVWFKAAGMIGSQASLDDLVQATLSACKSRDESHYNKLVHAWNSVDVKAS